MVHKNKSRSNPSRTSSSVVARESGEYQAEALEQSTRWGETVNLVERYKAGDHPALNEIFDRYYDRVYRIVRIEFQTGRYARMGQRIDPSDVVQETFIKALEIFDRFEMREPASLVRWLVTIAKNKLRDQYDRHGAGVRDMRRDSPFRYPSRENSSFTFDIAKSDILPAELVEQAEEKALLDECVAQLPDDWREVIIRRDYEGGSWMHIAEGMNRNRGAVQMLHSRARSRLAQIVAHRLKN